MHLLPLFRLSYGRSCDLPDFWHLPWKQALHSYFHNTGDHHEHSRELPILELPLNPINHHRDYRNASHLLLFIQLTSLREDLEFPCCLVWPRGCHWAFWVSFVHLRWERHSGKHPRWGKREEEALPLDPQESCYFHDLPFRSLLSDLLFGIPRPDITHFHKLASAHELPSGLYSYLR